MTLLHVLCVIIGVCAVSTILGIIADNLEENAKAKAKKVIDVYYIKRIVMLNIKIEEYSKLNHNVAISTCKRNQKRWAIMGGVIDDILINELISNCADTVEDSIIALREHKWNFIREIEWNSKLKNN